MAVELAWNEDPETVEQRQLAAAKTLADVAKWPHCNHDEASNVNDFDKEVRRAIDKGRAPEFTWSEYHDSASSSGWQVFCQTVADAILMDRDEIADALADAEHRLENDVGKPSATDGSKGQWQAGLQATINTYRWLLEGDDE